MELRRVAQGVQSLAPNPGSGRVNLESIAHDPERAHSSRDFGHPADKDVAFANSVSIAKALRMTGDAPIPILAALASRLLGEEVDEVGQGERELNS